MSSTPPLPAHPFRVRHPGDGLGAPAPLDLIVEGSAFGSGTHPTTMSCLEVLAALAPLEGLRVLDLGSGTGILGLAALRLGAAGALCVDVNPEAVASSLRSGEANGLADRLSHRAGTASDLAGEAFDLVVANIGGELLIDEAACVAPLARRGGRLLLSGVLSGYAADLQAAYAAQGCRVVERRFPGACCTILMTRG
ncbi:50S ribosomal protein L11 methyltransferase [Anaeromyxobacter oryzae]|uniref:SAM-dependent methyltransferase n=1 Tax=Anaeromyxobacter oryzae TaxID=2918170 RepID=A0ABN6MKW2_9BACT|nr:50S ribosomal protein L11 methyltransferase [Anaeromyxobacter oryzae]BDG01511.1 SAM-dependent methyltransferase [Anaeromyxobacter oryzae]